MNLFPYRGQLPVVSPDAFVAPTASIVGDVQVGSRSSIWYGAVLRGDVMAISIGERTSIQDNAVVHSTGGWTEALVGDDCTVGHSVILHGCAVGNRVLVGMGSILLDECEIGDDTMIGAGTLITARKKFPSGVLIHGRPGKVIRDLRPEELKWIRQAAGHYQDLVDDYLVPPPKAR